MSDYSYGMLNVPLVLGVGKHWGPSSHGAGSTVLLGPQHFPTLSPSPPTIWDFVHWILLSLTKTPKGSQFQPQCGQGSMEPEWECQWVNRFQLFSMFRFESKRIFKNRKQYHCTLCWVKYGKLKICTREGDLRRHLQSKRHSKKKEFFCLCSKSYTRVDALNRHKKTRWIEGLQTTLQYHLRIFYTARLYIPSRNI